MNRLLRKKKLISILLSVALVFSGIYVSHKTVNAAPAEVQVVTSLSSTTAKPGDTITVTVALQNYANYAKTIDSFKLSMNIDQNYFEFVRAAADTTTNYFDSFTMLYSTSGIHNEAFMNNNVELSFSDARYHLNRSTTNLYSFQLKVKSTITADAMMELTTAGATVVYTGESASNPLPLTSVPANLNILVAAPVIALTSSDAVHTNATYNNNVTVNLNKGTGEVYKDGTKVADVSSTNPYTASANGSYSIKNAKDAVGNTATETTFSISLGLKSISIASSPTKTTYLEGTATAIDPTGGVINLIYNNDSTSTVNLTAAMCTGYDLTSYSSTTPTQSVTVTYEGKTTNFNVNVTKKAVASIKVTSNPTKTVYSQGNTVSATGGKITVTYDNGTTEVVDMTAGMITSPDMATTGTKDVTVTYLGKTTTYAITVNDKVVTSFTLAGTSGLSVTEGMALGLSGVTANLVYDNGTTATLQVTAAMIKYTDAVGTQAVTVTVADVTNTFNITVNAKVATGISMFAYPKTNYKEGDAFSLSGAQIKVTYNNGTTSAAIDVTSAMISPATPIMSNYGVEQTVTITNSSFTTTYKYTVSSKQLSGISVTAPTKTAYVEKNAFSTAGGVITINYDNNTSATINLTSSYCTGYDMASVGSQTVTVTYIEGSITKTATFAIVVNAKSLTSISVNANPTVTTVLEGKTLSLAGGILNLAYDNADASTVDMTQATVTGFDSNKVGTQTITLNYGGKTTSLNVTVKAKTLTGIVVTAPTTTTYLTAQSLDTTGMKVSAVYDNDTNEFVTVPVAGITGFDNSKVGTQTITVKYSTMTATFNVKVLSRDALNAVNSSITTIQGKTLTVADATAVTALRTAYDALSSVEKAEVNESKIKAIETSMLALLYPASTTESTDKKVSVIAPIGSVSYEAKIIIAGITNNETLSSITEKINSKITNTIELLNTFDLSCVKKDDITKKIALNGSVEITVSLSDAIKTMMSSLASNEKIKVFFINDDGTIEDMNAVFTTSSVSFTTTHFSTYAIVKVTEPVVTEPVVTDQVVTGSVDATNAGVKTGDTTNVYIIMIVMICASGTLLTVRRKRKVAEEE